MSKKYVLLAVLIIAVLAVLIYRYSNRGGLSVTDIYSSPSGSVQPSGSSGNGVASGGIDSGLSYSKAVTKYATRRMQFDAGCQAIPKAPVVKNNTNMMFDNRSGDARWFSLDGKAYHLGGYGWIILNLFNSKLPHSVVVDCGAAQNVTTILLEK